MTRYPFVIVADDDAGQQSGSARAKSLLRVLGRRFGLRVEWLPSDTGGDTGSAAKTATRVNTSTYRTAAADAASVGDSFDSQSVPSRCSKTLTKPNSSVPATAAETFGFLRSEREVQ